MEIVKERLSKYLQMFRDKKGLSSRKGHLVFSATIIFLVYFVIQDWVEINLTWFTIYLFPLLIGILLPDLLEPAISPHHRNFFHSWRMLKIIIFYIIPITIISAYFVDERYFILVAFFAGYCLHLLPDSLTKRGLPLK